jgi:phosphoribosylformimino-5-aminoimidazole carboxamide ribotide isomerase
MLIVGVIDLLGGHAVHARAGLRQAYAPVAAVAGDAVRLACRHLETGVTDLYIADLNAILGRGRQDALIRAVTALGAPVWLDAGITSVDGARECLALGAAHVVVGLETLTSFDALHAIGDEVSGRRVAFSLDMRHGEPVRAFGSFGSFGSFEPFPQSNASNVSNESNDSNVAALARRAADAGVGSIIALDLARVGTGGGVDVQLIARVRAAAPRVTLLAGGGIRGLDDLMRLAEAGCDGALVATALHDGRIGATELAALR